MDRNEFVCQRVSECYRQRDFNCTNTTLHILAEHFELELADQVIDAGVGMHGAGGYRAQCGLVEGALMFTGILGKARGWSNKQVAAACHAFAQQFEDRFGSLLCRELRPEGFGPDNPPHLCEPLTCDTTLFALEFLTRQVETEAV
jgi:C_GCAxxG_C_C family probable redox protein